MEPTTVTWMGRETGGGLRAVRYRIRARITEGLTRSTGDHACLGCEAHPGRQPPVRATEGIAVRPDAARSSRECDGTVGADDEFLIGSSRQDKGRHGTVATVTWMGCETVAAGCELSVTEYTHESRKLSPGVPAITRVAGAKPIPDGRPAQLCTAVTEP